MTKHTGEYVICAYLLLFVVETRGGNAKPDQAVGGRKQEKTANIDECRLWQDYEVGAVVN